MMACRAMSLRRCSIVVDEAPAEQTKQMSMSILVGEDDLWEGVGVVDCLVGVEVLEEQLLMQTALRTMLVVKVLSWKMAWAMEPQVA